MHQLDITYKNTWNCKTLRIEDNSIYDCALQAENIILEVKPPGRDCFISFPKPNNNWYYTVLNCNNLDLCCGNSLTVLPDGIYEIKYSIAPNLKSQVHFYHQRVCQIMKRYISSLGEYLSNKCNYTTAEKEKVEKELSKIKELIDWSVYKIEECGEKEEGLELYDEANLLLSKFEKNGQTCSKC